MNDPRQVKRVRPDRVMRETRAPTACPSAMQWAVFPDRYTRVTRPCAPHRPSNSGPR